MDLLERSRTPEDKLLELDRQRDKIIQTLVEIDAELVYNNLSHHRVTNSGGSAKEERMNFLFVL